MNLFHKNSCLMITFFSINSLMQSLCPNLYIRRRSRKCIWGHAPMHAIIVFFYLPVLSRPSFTTRTPKIDFISFKSYNPETFIRKHLEKVPRPKSSMFLVPLSFIEVSLAFKTSLLYHHGSLGRQSKQGA